MGIKRYKLRPKRTEHKYIEKLLTIETTAARIKSNTSSNNED